MIPLRLHYCNLICVLLIHVSFSAHIAPSGSKIEQYVLSERSIQGTFTKIEHPPTSFSRTNMERRAKIEQLNRQEQIRPEHPFSELNQLSYSELIDLLVTIEWSDIPGLFTFTPDSYEFFRDQNRVQAIIDAIGSRGSQFTTSDHMGLPTLIEVLRAGFYLGFYNDELKYLNNKEPFIQNIVPAQEKIVNNANFDFGTETQDNVIRAMGYLLGIGKTNKTVVLNLVPLMKKFNDNFASWVDNYDKSTAWWGIGNGVDYALVAVDLYVNPDATQHPCYNTIDSYWDELVTAAKFGTITDDNVWGLNNAVWWTGRIGQFVVKPKQVNTLLDIIDLYGKWEQPSLEAVKVLDAYYPDDHPFDIDKVKEEVHNQLLPNYYRFDNGKIIFNVGTAVSLEKVKTLYWAIKEVKAQFHRYIGRDEPMEQGHPDDSLTAIVYSSPDDYNYNNFLYGLSTSNGGIYIECWGIFFTYERAPQQSIYTLEDLFRHEYTHFLQSRYYTPGFWGGALWDNDRLTWFEEGGAEFTAGSSRDKKIRYRKAMAKNIASNASSRMTLPEVLAATYASGFTFYTYACVFFSYMHVHRMDILNKLLDYVKANDASGYDSYIAQLKSDGALSTAYNNYMQELVDNANNFVDPVTSPDYLANIPDGNLNTIIDAIKTETGISTVTAQKDSSAYYHTYLISGTYTGISGLNQLAAWADMDDKVDSFLDKLDDKPWEGYKTVTCYFTDYTTSGGNYQFEVTFRGILKKGDAVPIIDNATVIPVTSAGLIFQNPYIPGTAIHISLPENAISQKVSIEIFDITGRMITHIPVHNESTVKWNGTNRQNNRIANGLYIVKLNVHDKVVTKTLLLSR